MGALLSLPLMAIPSMGTVSSLPSANEEPFADDSSLPNRSSRSAAHAAVQQLALRYAAHVENFRTGTISWLPNAGEFALISA